jgi:hypothetical protein
MALRGLLLGKDMLESRLIPEYFHPVHRNEVSRKGDEHAVTGDVAVFNKYGFKGT